MRFTWRAAKRRSNLARHKIDLADAQHIWRNPVIEAYDDRDDYGEDRYRAIGHVNGRVLFVVYTTNADDPDEVYHLISARRATNEEAQAYWSEFPP